MTVRSGAPTLLGLLLLAAVVPLRAQFTTTGCPSGPTGPQLNGFTAGTPSSSTICLNGTFISGLIYDVTLTDTNNQQQTTIRANATTPQITVSVPASFYATVSQPGQADPVTISIVATQVGASSQQTGSFQINPPMVEGGPSFISAENAPISWNLFSGGTAPYSTGFYAGNVPNGMAAFPLTGQTWSGTPTPTGIYSFTLYTTDGWGNSLFPNFAAYIVPRPAITSLSQTSVAVGSGDTSININGSGFVSSIDSEPMLEPSSLVYVTPRQSCSSSPVVLTPTAVVASQLTVTLPACLLTNTGNLSLQVVNPGSITSNTQAFLVTPSITGLSAYSRTAGAPAFPLGVTGAGFVNGSVVKMNGTSIPTTFVNSANLTATFPSVPTPGTVLITVLNPDGTLTPVPQDLVIQAAPLINSLNPASVTAGGTAFSLNVIGTNFQTGMTVYFNSSPMPTALLTSNRNQLVASVPASAIVSAGTVPVSLGTSDGYRTPGFPFTIVAPGPPPLQLLTFSPLPPGVVNTPYSFTFMASQGAGGYTFSVTDGTLPAGLKLSSAGVLSGTPTAIGSSQFTLQVADSSQGTVSRIFTINIAPQPLTLTTGPLSNTIVNTPISVQFAGSGGVPPYTFVEFGALPPGVDISRTGLLSGTPTKAGTYPFQLFINDTAGASANKNYTLNVALPGLLITPPSPLPSGEINQPYTTQLAATGGIGPPYTWSATGLPQGLTIANNSGLIAGIPRAAGTFTLGVTITDYSGAAATQNYTLVIASGTLIFSTTSLSNGAVGSSYSATVSASGGSGIFTYTASGLPPGVTMASSGTLSGTPTTAGTYTVAVTATDSTGLTASTSYKVTIAPQLVVTPVTLPDALVGTAISAVTLTATGGTPPYQWQSANLPPGLILALNGTLSGTPTAQGTFSFTVYAIDNNGALSSGTEQLTVGLPTAPSATISGLPPSNAPATQPFLQVVLANPYSATITANLTLTFAPASGPDDPSIQFSTGGRSAQLVIPAGSTSGLTNVGVQTGTVAGTITITAQLVAGGVDVTPTPAPSESITVTAGAPVITGVTATRTSTGFTVKVTGFASNRGVDGGTYQFSASEGASLGTSQLATSITSLFAQWYSSSSSAPFGSQFTLTQPFSVAGSTSAVLSVSVTLTNALGTSPASSAILQ